MVVEFNQPIRYDDEWFDEPDELDRIEKLLGQLDAIAAAHAVSRISRSQAFREGNKRTALLVGRWILDRNGIDELRFIPAAGTDLGGMLLSSARGADETERITRLSESRHQHHRGLVPNRVEIPVGVCRRSTATQRADPLT
jgi:hypothetical protein